MARNANDRRWYGAGLVLCAAAAAGVAKIYMSGPSGAAATASHAGSFASHHTGAGGNGPLPEAEQHFQRRVTTTFDVPESGDASTQTATEPAAAQANNSCAATQPDDTDKPFLERDRMTGDWFGLRNKLEDKGLTINASLQTTAGKVFAGGLDSRDIGESFKFSLGLTASAEKLINIKGGTFYLNFHAMDGKKNSLDGAFQSTSQLYEPRREQISELWYEQKLLDDKLRFKAGKIDANTEFDVVNNATEFVNSSMSYSPAIANMPTDPDPAMGVVAFVYPNDNFYAGAGLFDGSLHEGLKTGARGPASLFENSLFVIAEAGIKWTTARHQDGRLALGGWGHTGQFERFSGGQDNSTAGPYAVVDQTIWRKNPDVDMDTQGLGAFLQFGYADPDVSAVDYHVGAGLAWTGPITSRPADVIGLGSTWVDFTKASGSGYVGGGEFILETFYKISLTPWLSIKPDIQYIANPRGIAGRPDTIVGSVQANLTF